MRGGMMLCPHCHIEMILLSREEIHKDNKKKIEETWRCSACGYMEIEKKTNENNS